MWEKLSEQTKTGPTDQVKYVLDGGALLHRVPCPRLVTYEKLWQRYCHYVQRKYGEGTVVVFDGYDHPTTKNITHQRRSAGKVGATVSFDDGIKVTIRRDVFLANTQNRKRFVTLLRRYLEDSGCQTLQADGDADVLIVKTSTAAERPTVLVGDDTDLLVLLCFYPSPHQNKSKYGTCEKSKQSWVALCVIACCSCTRFSVATQRLAPLGLESQHLSRNSVTPATTEKFDAADTCTDDVVKAGENALVAMYGGRQGESLDSLRHRNYLEKVCTKGRQVEPQNLPPTSAAARFHSMRVFLQVKQWQGEDSDLL